MDPVGVLETILVAAGITTVLTLTGVLFGLVRIASGGGILRAEDFPAPGVSVRAQEVEARMRARYMSRAQGALRLAARSGGPAFVLEAFDPETFVPETFVLDPVLPEPAGSAEPAMVMSPRPAAEPVGTRRRNRRHVASRPRVAA